MIRELTLLAERQTEEAMRLKTFMCSLAAGAFIAGTLTTQGSAQSPKSSAKNPSLLVVNQADASLSIIDPVSGKQTAVFNEGVPKMVGHEVTTSTDGRLAYLPLYGDSGVGKPGFDGHLMLVIDLATQKVVNKLDFGRGVRPHCIINDKKSGLLYVTTELDKAVTIIDPHTLTIVGSIPTNQEESHMLAISHDGRRGYTANVGPGTVSVLDLAARRFVTTIPIAKTTQRISISNDDSMVFTSDQDKPRMAVIDTVTNKIKTWIELPSIGYGSAPTPDGKTLLVTLLTGNALAAVDLKTLKVVQTIKVGERPQEVLVRPDGKVAYVSCFGGHQVAEVDLSKRQVTRMIDAGQKADGMGWAAGE
jgi:YVTN family beta-propeller protein